MKTAEFKEFKGSQRFSLTDSRHGGKRDRVSATERIWTETVSYRNAFSTL